MKRIAIITVFAAALSCLAAPQATTPKATSASTPPALNPSLKLADPNAAPRTRALFARLLRSYGEKTLSGQYDAEDSNYILKAAGRVPAVFGADFMDYSPSRVAFAPAPSDLTERAIRRAERGQIITMSWHWNAPTALLNKMLKDTEGKDLDAKWYKGFYTYATTFDLAAAIDDSKSEGYKLLLRDIDAIAVQLRKFASARVPVLWRPLHEAEGGWFWWGAKGPDAFVKLWRLMFQRLTEVHHLHNLIWVYTAGSNADWYPGDAYVNIVGADAYPSDHADPLLDTWNGLVKQYGHSKLLALTEFGGVPDVPRMHKLGVTWDYFVSWPGEIRPPETAVSDLIRIYRSSAVRNRTTR